MNNLFNISRNVYEERFINAETAYQRYKVFKDLLSWVETLYELNEAKDKRIAELESSIKGYDLDDYKD